MSCNLLGNNVDCNQCRVYNNISKNFSFFFKLIKSFKMYFVSSKTLQSHYSLLYYEFYNHDIL